MDFKIRIRGVDFLGEMILPRTTRAFVIATIPEDNEHLSCVLRVAKELKKNGIATVMCSLLTEREMSLKEVEKIEIITERFIPLSKWCVNNSVLKYKKQGYLGFDYGADIVLSTAAYWGTKVGAVVVIDGNSKNSLSELDLVESPTLLLVSENSGELDQVNRQSFQKLGCIKKIETHLEADKICVAASGWFKKFLIGTT